MSGAKRDGGKNRKRGRRLLRIGRGRSPRIGLAIARDHLAAVEVRRTLRRPRIRRVFTRPIDDLDGEGAHARIKDALVELRKQLRRSSLTVGVAVCSPVAQVKRLEVPSLGRADLERLLARNARRFFAIDEQDVVADAVSITRRRGRSPTLAAVAPSAMLDAFLAAAEEADVAVESLCPGPHAAARAATALTSGLRRGLHVVVVRSCDGFEALFLERRRVVLARTLARVDGVASGCTTRPGAGDAAPAARRPEFDPEALRVILDQSRERFPVGADRITLLGLEDAAVDAIRRVVPNATVDAARVAAPDAMPPCALHAFGAALPGHRRLTLSPASHRARLRARARRAVAVRAVAAVVLLMAAGWLHLTGLRRDLARLDARRDRLRPAVDEASRARTAIDAARTRLARLREAEASTSNWTRLFADLARTLPDDAYLEALRADDAGLRLEGSAGSVAEAAAALEEVRGVIEVRIATPVQERSGGPEGRQRMSLVLAIDSGGGP